MRRCVKNPVCLFLSLFLTAVLLLQMLPAVSAFAASTETKTVPGDLDTSASADAYGCTSTDKWVPMFPTGRPDNGTWPEWDESHYGRIVEAGNHDLGALYLKSDSGKNTGIAINAGMTAGESYTLSLWAKGTSNSGRVLALYANGDPNIIGEPAELASDWHYYEIKFTATGSQLNIVAADWGVTDIYVDNIALTDSNGTDLLSGCGDFLAEETLPVTQVPTTVNANRRADAYTCPYTDRWVPMYPTGSPDSGTWAEWDSTHYGEVVQEGYQDIGSLHLKSIPEKNAGVAINPGMTPGESYTLGLWAKGTSNSGRVLALYANGDPAIIGKYTELTADWSYYEITFTATGSQLNIIAVDWGITDLYIDNITLTDGNGTDLLAGSGDFWEENIPYLENANLDFEKSGGVLPLNWTHKGVLADSSMRVYSDNVYSGNQALRVHRQYGQLDYSFIYSQAFIPVAVGDKIEVVAHISSRSSISGSFSMFFLGLGENVDGGHVETAYGQERITNAGDTWSQWDTYEMTYTVAPGVKYIQIALRIGGTCADVLIDDLQFYNYTDSGNVIYAEDFDAPSVTTGLPGGWEKGETGSTAAVSGYLALTGDENTNGTVSTKLYSLMTAHPYSLTAQVFTTGTATGQLVLEAVNWKGEVTGQAVDLTLNTASANQQLQVDFEALSAVYYRLILRKTGGDGKVCIRSLQLQKTGEPSAGSGEADSGENNNTGSTTAPTTTSSVEVVGGKTTLLVNGEPQVPMWYARPENPILYEPHTVTKFAEVGVNTVVSYIFLNNNYGDVWTKDGFVPDAVDDMMLSTLAGNPDAQLIVALDFNAPQWWCEENPGELAALADSTPERTNASFASEKWKEEAGAIMVEAINYMMRQPYADNIIGFKVTGGYTLEWNWWATSGVYDDVGDFSQCGVDAFRAWLTEKYGTDKVLQDAYSDNTVTLANAMPPSSALRSDDYLDTVITVQDHPEMMDYELYMAELKADTIEYFAKLVKDAVDDRLIVGTYGGYFYMGGGYEFSSAVANVYFQRMLQSEYIDFIKSPWVYGMREIGDSAEFMGPVDSLDLYGKLWIVEDDTRLNLQEMSGSQDDSASVGWTRNYQQSVEQLKRNYSYVLSKGMGVSFYNLMWNFTDDDQYYGAIGQMYEEMDISLNLSNESVSDIAVFVDGESQMLIPYEEEVLNSVLYVSVYREQLEELGHIGAPYDMYLLDDLKDGLVPEHKINIFLGTTMITDEERAAIESQLQKNGNILVWIFTDGISDGKTTDIDLMSQLTGMKLQVISTERKKIAAAGISNNTHWLTEGMELKQYYGVENYDKMSPVIAVKDSSATALAYHSTTDGTAAAQVALAVKDMGNWTSIYSAVPNMPQIMFRNMLEQAGGHIYTESGSDVIYASDCYVALHSIFAGTRTIDLPGVYTVYDVFSGKTVAADAESFQVTLTGKETRLFRLMEANKESAFIDTSKMTGAYTAYPGEWVPMFPTGAPDSGTWAAWSAGSHYAQIVENGHNDLGALHLKSYYHKNVGVAIDAGMTAGEVYTLGLWARGTSDSGRVLALYANGDPLIVASPSDLTADWSYYEITFTAGISQINLMASDWGNTDIYVDNITLKNAAGVDLLSGYGDFWTVSPHSWKDATCTAPKTCSICGTVRGEPLGHSYGEWVVTKTATLTEAGEQQKTCSICGDVITEEISCLTGDVEGWSLTLGGDLSVNFKIDVNEAIRDTAQIVITVADDAYIYNVKEISADPDDNCYYISVKVAAAQMGDAIIVQIVNGEDASKTKSYTVVQYAQTILANEEMSQYHQLVKEMLNYGAAAQTYFDYDADNLVNAGIEGVGAAEVPETADKELSIEGAARNIIFYGASLVFENKIAVRYYFTVSGDIAEHSFTVNGESCEAVQKDDYYYIEAAGVDPQDLDDSITVVADEALSVTYSPMNYIVRMAVKGSDNLKALVKAMYNYHRAAEVLCPDAV